MKLANVKGMVVKAMTVGLLAGAFAMVAPTKAQAQVFVAVGHPRYDVYRRDHFDHIRREEFIRHQEWVRAHEFGGYRHAAPYRFR